MQHMKRFLPSSKVLTSLYVVISLFFIETAMAQRVASVSGNWNSTATWGGSAVPTSAQTVTINSGVVVTVTAAANAASVTVNGTLNVTGGNLTITNGGSVVNNNGGSIVFSSSNVINGGGGGSNGILIDINAGASLTTANANGFNIGTGSFQHTAGNRAQTYDAGANYTYNGGTQNTGANLPTNLTGTLTINSSATVTLNSARIIASGGVINLDGGTFATGSNLTMASTSSIVRSGGAITGTFQGTGVYNVTYTGSSKTTGIELVNGGLNDVTVNLTSGQTLTLDTNRAPDGNLNITSGIFDLSTFTINRSAAGGTLTVSNGSVLKIGGTNPFPTNYSTHSIGNTSTVEYSGTTQTVSNLNSSQSYGNLVFSGAGTKTLSSGTLGVVGDWTIGSSTAANTNNPTINLSGSFNLNSGTFSSSSATFSIEGNWSNTGTFTAGTGTVNFNGSNQSITGATTFNNLSLTNGSVKTFNNVITSGSLSIASGTQANLGTGLTHPANSLTLGTSGTNIGTWGSTSSSATYKNNTYFGATTGIVNVATNTAATPTVAPTIGSYTYTGLQQGPDTATNTGSGTSYTFSYVGVSGTVYGPSATKPTNAGNYTVTATVANSADGFYRSASSTATSFSIAVRALAITAGNDSKTYGQVYAVGPGSTAFTSSGLQNSETIGSITIASTGAVNTAGVGSYDIIPSAATGGTFTASNYSITYSNGTLTVTAATLFITANNGSKVYGTNQTTPVSGSTAFGSTGLQNSETIGSVTLTYGSGALAATDAVGSTSTITPSAATGGSFVASNYNVIYLTNSGTLTVTAAPLTITANNGTKVYGTTQSTPVSGSAAFGSTGLQNGETIGSVTLTYGSGALAATDAVGSTSTITPSAATGGTFTASNYNITYTPNSGTLTVTVATLTITADNDSKTYGQTYTVGAGSTAFTSSGLQNGETIGSITTASTGAVNTASVGSYNIVPSAATGGTFTASNYSISYTNGTLTVNPAALTITANNATKCYGDTYSSTTNFTPTGLVLGETVGSVTLTSSGSASGAAPGTYSIVPSAATGGTFTASNYSITYTNGTLTVSSANTWTGVTSTAWTATSNWSCGYVPNSATDVIISSATFYPEISSDVTINSLTLDSGTTLKVNSSNSLTVTDVVDNDGTLTLENNAYLLQTNNVTNTGSGSTIVKCNSSAIMRLDYTMWSSPVTGQGLYAFSPSTFANRFYQYLTATDLYNNSLGFAITGLDVNGVNGTDGNNVSFATAKGYLIRTPWNHPTTPTVWTGQFTGLPNNGNIGYTLETTGNKYNAVGNPYPSPISISTFLTDNSSLIGSTLWFWRKTNNPNNLITPTTSYITYSGGTYSSGNEPNYNIQPGQGFIVQGTTSGSLQFNNSQRVATDGRFFRNNTQVNTAGEGRIWLNLVRGTELAASLAIGYKDGATNDLDADFDGKYINDSQLALTSFVQGQELAVQHRATPFVDTDVVPLSFKTNLAGTYSIAFNGADGILNTQDVYLLDLLLNQSVDIKANPYSFTSEAGIFADRFKIVYVDNALGNGAQEFNANQVVIYQNQVKDFVIETGNIVMSEIKVFDIRGRLIFEQKEINDSQTTINVGQTNEVLLVQITSQEGLVVTKKVIR